MSCLFRKCPAFVGVLVVLGVAGGGTSVANASSYLRLDGVTVDPILIWGTSTAHSYTGPNLEPYASLPGIDLQYAEVSSADLRHANLSNGNLSGSEFRYSDFSGANLSFIIMDHPEGTGLGRFYYGANLRYALLNNVYNQGPGGGSVSFFGADLTGATFSDTYNGSWTINPGWDFTNAILFGADLSSEEASRMTNFAGAKYSLNAKDNSGNPIPDTLFPAGFDPVAAGMVLVPEPGTVLLVGIGLVGMSAVSQRHHRRGTIRRV